jgi:hypothetical protein
MHVSVKAFKSIRIHVNVSEKLKRKEMKAKSELRIQCILGLHSEKRWAIK